MWRLTVPSCLHLEFLSAPFIHFIKFNLVTLNVNGLCDPNKQMTFLQWLSHLSADFVCLQETHVVSCDECSSWFFPLGYSSVSSPGVSHSCGTVLLFRSKYFLTKTVTDSNGRFVLAEFKFNELTFRVASLYAPNRNPARSDFFDYVIDCIDPSIPSFVGGDFNAVFNPSLDRRGSSCSDFSHVSLDTLRSLFDDCCIIDSWRTSS